MEDTQKNRFELKKIYKKTAVFELMKHTKGATVTWTEIAVGSYKTTVTFDGSDYVIILSKPSGILTFEAIKDNIQPPEMEMTLSEEPSIADLYVLIERKLYPDSDADRKTIAGDIDDIETDCP